MKVKKYVKKSSVSALAVAMVLSSGIFNQGFKTVKAADFTGQLTGVVSASVDSKNKNIVNVEFNDGVKGKITFLENGLFRYNIDPKGEFEQYATPSGEGKNYTAKIQAQPDDSDYYTQPEAAVSDTGAAFKISSDGATVILDKSTGKMSILDSNDNIVMSENESLKINNNSTVQSLNENDDENFFGGGAQNGRFTHKGKSINIKNESGWTDGGVSSPSPFYWSTKGYGVLRNTFKEGVYDFGKSADSTVKATHNEAEFDAYYFVSSDNEMSKKAETLLNDYYAVTGNPMLLPEYSYYLAHLNCYNRDGWKESTNNSGWILEDGKRYNELGQAWSYVIPEGTLAESLNNTPPTVQTQNFKGVINEDTYKFSARAVVDGYENEDMPLGWFIPNDGYGCGYGQNGYDIKRNPSNPAQDNAAREEAVDANVANLRSFVDYNNTKGIKTGLWAQSALNPDDSEKHGNYRGYQFLRDFDKEVNNGGVAALKTDVNWVFPGYSYALTSQKTGYDTIAKSGLRPTVITLDGWAGSQRYGSSWTGDQYGGNWEYIRFHIPTYIGIGLSGNPNIGTDINGIFSGGAIVQTRDFQWKTFTQNMLNMDGWGSEAKKPYYHGDPYTSINRMYLKMKAELMPYLYSEGIKSVDGLPSIRAMFLEYPDEEYNYGKGVQYQYMYGSNFLVAPVYEDVNGDEQGNDVRNGIYLPGGEEQLWIDYFTGQQYRGGQVINNFDAPIWKLPLFVKNGAIVPMSEEHNNPSEITETNPKGLDKSKRVVEFWPSGESTYELKEDDGISMDFSTSDQEERDVIKYGDQVTTNFTSKVEGDKATLTAEVSKGTYTGYNSNRKTTFVINVQEKPASVEAKNGSKNLTIKEATSLEEYNTLAEDDNVTVYYYDAAPNFNKYSLDDEAFKDTVITMSPKVYVKFAKTDVSEEAQTLIVNGFNNSMELAKNELNPELVTPANLKTSEDGITPTSIALEWDAAEKAVSYDLEVDGTLFNLGTDAEGNAIQSFDHTALSYGSSHDYRVRSRNEDGFSEWSDILTVVTSTDPWENVLTGTATWTGGYYSDRYASKAVDHILQAGDAGFHSDGNAVNNGDKFTMDFGMQYKLDKLEYYQRFGGGNGTASQMRVRISLDGTNWKDLGIQKNSFTTKGIDDASCSVIDLSNYSARYVQLIPTAASGGYFSASEFAVYKQIGTSGITVGSNNGVVNPDESWITQIKAYSGAYEGSTNWGQVKDADINFNNVYDVYDMSHALFKMDGGTSKTGNVAGNIMLINNKNTVKAGEEYTIDFYGVGLKNVNAFGGIFEYDNTKFDFVKMNVNPALGYMDNYTANYRKDDKNLLTVSVMNRGDKDLVSGTQLLGTITMKAKVDGDVYKPSEAMLIGPNYSLINTNSNADTGELPDIPLSYEAEYGKDDFNLTLTNEFLPTDDGNNVKLVSQQKSFDNLFNDVTSYVDGKVFELMWDWEANWIDGKLPEYVTLPLTLHYELKKPNPMTKIDYYNRASGNGSIKKMEAEVFFEDGTTQKFAFNEQKPLYSMVIDKDNLGKNVTKVDITPLESNSKTMLTICEINLFYQKNAVVEDVVLDENNPSVMNVGEMAEFKASVLPEDIPNPYYKVESNNKNVVDVVRIKNGEAFTYLVKAVGAGTAKLKVSSAGDPTKFVETTITVNGSGEVEDTAFLKEILGKAMAKVDAISEDDMASLAPKVQAMINDAYAAADAVMKNEAATKDQCLEAWLNLANALHYADFKADKAELKAMIDYCNGLKEDDYSAGFEAMLKALETAQGVYDDENALQTRIDKAYSDLLNATNALVENVDTAKKYLAELVAMFDEIDSSKYCANAAWATFVKAMDDAKVVLANNDATASQINNALLELTSAYVDIRLLPDENALNDLKAFIAKVEALDLSAYGAENAARFMSALGNARTIVNDPNTYDPAIFSEIKAINDIIDNGETLTPKDPTTGVEEPTAPEENVTPAPEKPSAPDTSANGTTKPGTTKTGDATNMMSIFGMLLASGAGLFAANKKRKSKK